MAESFGIPQLTQYLKQMNVKIAKTDVEKEVIELAFHGEHGNWRMIIGLQQRGNIRKLMLIAPHIATVTEQKRLECLEALMAVNYRIAIGKFGLDLSDGEVRLEETIPLANNVLTLEQFQLAFGAIMQTVAMYQTLLSRIVFGNLAPREALHACEQDFFQGNTSRKDTQPLEVATTEQRSTELSLDDVMAEVSRIFEEGTNI